MEIVGTLKIRSFSLLKNQSALLAGDGVSGLVSFCRIDVSPSVQRNFCVNVLEWRTQQATALEFEEGR